MQWLVSKLLLATVVSVCSAHVEKQFRLPALVRAPFFDVDMEAGPLQILEDVDPDRIVSLNHMGAPLKCILPSPSFASNETLPPITDPETLAQARAALEEYHLTKHVYLDDVWAWNFDFDSHIIQGLPREVSDGGEFKYVYTHDSFQAYIGRSDNSQESITLSKAIPVQVDDQNMLLTRYVNGTMCDLTLEPRNARIFFKCMPDAEPAVPVIISIDEPYACTYEFVIGIKELCSVEGFQRPWVPVDTIRCGLDPDSFVEWPQDLEDDTEYTYEVDEPFPDVLPHGPSDAHQDPSIKSAAGENTFDDVEHTGLEDEGEVGLAHQSSHDYAETPDSETLAHESRSCDGLGLEDIGIAAQETLESRHSSIEDDIHEDTHEYVTDLLNHILEGIVFEDPEDPDVQQQVEADPEDHSESRDAESDPNTTATEHDGLSSPDPERQPLHDEL